jgi:hypothetical protein
MLIARRLQQSILLCDMTALIAIGAVFSLGGKCSMHTVAGVPLALASLPLTDTATARPQWLQAAHAQATKFDRPQGFPRLTLRGGSSAWSNALLQARANGARRNDLSLEETRVALRQHGLAVSASQVVELLHLNGATEFERVSEIHFSAALARHPPSSVLGRWQQVSGRLPVHAPSWVLWSSSCAC